MLKTLKNLMKMNRPWTGKKSETDPVKKETHKERKNKKEILHSLEVLDWELQLKEYKYENQSFQE